MFPREHNFDSQVFRKLDFFYLVKNKCLVIKLKLLHHFSLSLLVLIIY